MLIQPEKKGVLLIGYNGYINAYDDHLQLWGTIGSLDPQHIFHVRCDSLLADREKKKHDFTGGQQSHVLRQSVRLLINILEVLGYVCFVD